MCSFQSLAISLMLNTGLLPPIDVRPANPTRPTRSLRFQTHAQSPCCSTKSSRSCNTCPSSGNASQTIQLRDSPRPQPSPTDYRKSATAPNLPKLIQYPRGPCKRHARPNNAHLDTNHHTSTYPYYHLRSKLSLSQCRVPTTSSPIARPIDYYACAFSDTVQRYTHQCIFA